MDDSRAKTRTGIHFADHMDDSGQVLAARRHGLLLPQMVLPLSPDA